MLVITFSLVCFAVTKFFTVDGKTPSIACVTTGGKIILHSPHETVGSDGTLNSLRYLNLNRKITAIAAGG